MGSVVDCSTCHCDSRYSDTWGRDRPEMDGFEVCRRIRTRAILTPGGSLRVVEQPRGNAQQLLQVLRQWQTVPAADHLAVEHTDPPAIGDTGDGGAHALHRRPA